MSDQMRFGFAERSITPRHEVDLYRFGPESRTSRRVLDELKVKTVVLEDRAGERLAIVCLDLIWVSREFCFSVRDRARRELGLRPECILLAATHTHCSPQIRPNVFNGSKRDAEYETFLAGQVWACLAEAAGALGPGRLSLASARSEAAVYRRKKVPDLQALKRLRLLWRMANRPVLGVRHEGTLSALWFHRADGKPAGLLLNLACHSSLFRGNAVSADFPGRMAAQLAERFGPDFSTLFLQGFSGDLRPNLVHRAPLSLKNPLRSAYHLLFDRLLFVKDTTEAEMEGFAAERVAEILAVPAEQLGEVECSASWQELQLPVEPLLPVERYRELSRSALDIEREYGRFIIENYEHLTTVPLLLQRLSLSSGMTIIALEGEIFMEYALWLRKIAAAHGRRVLPVGCANGMIGYVPDAKSLKIGGYETDRSLVLFGLPTRFTARIEPLIKEAVSVLLEQK